MNLPSPATVTAVTVGGESGSVTVAFGDHPGGSAPAESRCRTQKGEHGECNDVSPHIRILVMTLDVALRPNRTDAVSVRISPSSVCVHALRDSAVNPLEAATGNRALDHLAGAVLDGTPIDWTSATSGVDALEGQLLDRLRLLASIAEFHRQLPSSPAPPADHRLEPPVHWGHLRVLEPIGRGAFGEVYRAWDTRLDREVALKLLPAESSPGGDRSASIIEEGRLLARVRHPNVVTIYGAERIDDRIGLWMEFVKGRTLEQTIEAGRRLHRRGSRRHRDRALSRRCRPSTRPASCTAISKRTTSCWQTMDGWC